MLEHKGYTGVMEVDVESGVISGRVIGLRDVVTFQGDTVPQAVQAFRDSVDDYLEFCAERGESPEKPYSGKFLLRLPPELHRMLANTAEAAGRSLNSFIEDLLWNSMCDCLYRPPDPSEHAATRHMASEPTFSVMEESGQSALMPPRPGYRYVTGREALRHAAEERMRQRKAKDKRS